MSKEISTGKIWLTASVNSLIIGLFVFWIIYSLSVIITGAFADFFGIENISLLNETPKSLKSDFNVWKTRSIAITFSITPILNIGLLVLSIFLHSKAKKHKGLFKLIYIWGIIFSLCFSFGYIAIGIFTGTGFGEISIWLYFSGIMNVLIIIICFFTIIVMGDFYSKKVFRTAISKVFIKSRLNRILFLFSHYIIPLAIIYTTAVLANLNYSSHLGFLLLFSATVIFMIPLFRNRKTFKKVRLVKEHHKPGIVWGWLIVSIVIIFVYRLFLINDLLIH